MLIRNVQVFDNDTLTSQLKNVYVAEGRREILDLSDNIEDKKIDSEIDVNGSSTLMPGLLDPHVHGQGGFDFGDKALNPENIAHIAKKLGLTGLAYAMPTLVSLELGRLKESVKAISDYMEQQQNNPLPGTTQFVGIHLEGPFIAKNCRGAHDINVLQDAINISLFRDIISAAPYVTHWKITLDPDLKGALEFIRESKKLEKEGLFVKVFLGHTNPLDKETISKAIAAGAAGFTHLGNACQETCCRLTRELEEKDATSHLVQWVLEHPEECPPGVELIVDGEHLTQPFVSLVYKTVGDKIIVITDALGPAGLDDGLYMLGTLRIRKEGSSFYLADEAGDFIMKEGTLPSGEKGLVKSLAGSGSSLSFCLENFHNFIATPEQSEQDSMRSFFKALLNSRTGTLSPAMSVATLNDDSNFVLIDNASGKLMLSLCNGHIIDHQNILPMNLKQGPTLSLNSMFARPIFNSNQDKDKTPASGDTLKKKT